MAFNPRSTISINSKLTMRRFTKIDKLFINIDPDTRNGHKVFGILGGPCHQVVRADQQTFEIEQRRASTDLLGIHFANNIPGPTPHLQDDIIATFFGRFAQCVDGRLIRRTKYTVLGGHRFVPDLKQNEDTVWSMEYIRVCMCVCVNRRQKRRSLL